jgi:hypothetical protein
MSAEERRQSVVVRRQEHLERESASQELSLRQWQEKVRLIEACKLEGAADHLKKLQCRWGVLVLACYAVNALASNSFTHHEIRSISAGIFQPRYLYDNHCLYLILIIYYI